MPAKTYFLDTDGHIRRPPEIIECMDDHDAIERSTQFVNGCAISKCGTARGFLAHHQWKYAMKKMQTPRMDDRDEAELRYFYRARGLSESVTNAAIRLRTQRPADASESYCSQMQRKVPLETYQLREKRYGLRS